MTPEKKALELVRKYYYLFSVELENTIDYREAKQCALIAVYELIKQVSNCDVGYWQEVKQEIEKL
jgi:hypothetical protein